MLACAPALAAAPAEKPVGTTVAPAAAPAGLSVAKIDSSAAMMARAA